MLPAGSLVFAAAHHLWNKQIKTIDKIMTIITIELSSYNNFDTLLLNDGFDCDARIWWLTAQFKEWHCILLACFVCHLMCTPETTELLCMWTMSAMSQMVDLNQPEKVLLLCTGHTNRTWKNENTELMTVILWVCIIDTIFNIY